MTTHDDINFEPIFGEEFPKRSSEASWHASTSASPAPGDPPPAPYNPTRPHSERRESETLLSTVREGATHTQKYTTLELERQFRSHSRLCSHLARHVNRTSRSARDRLSQNRLTPHMPSLESMVEPLAMPVRRSKDMDIACPWGTRRGHARFLRRCPPAPIPAASTQPSTRPCAPSRRSCSLTAAACPASAPRIPPGLRPACAAGGCETRP